MPYTWGEPSGSLPEAPDVIVGADVVYEQEHYAALVSSLHMLAAPHTVVYLSYRLRGMLFVDPGNPADSASRLLS